VTQGARFSSLPKNSKVTQFCAATNALSLRILAPRDITGRPAKFADKSRENRMAECPDFRESLVQTGHGIDGAIRSSPWIQSGPAADKYFAYNQTRERFLCVDVEAADFSNASLNTRLPALTPDCGSALWILPFRGISPTSVRVPLDLVFLDRNCLVLDAVESFPISQPAPSRTPAESLLVLPANTISATGTYPGDRLLLCAPEEARWSLHAPQANANIPAERRLVSAPGAASANDRPGNMVGGKVLQMADRSCPMPAHENPLIDPPISKPEQPAQPAQKKTPKNWLQRWLSVDPPDPRKTQREALTWLTAYFFTGGRPVAQGVRDISGTGLYVLTEERWYLGTVIRITLTDLRQPIAERSCTVNAKVVRWGNDGVGFQFLLTDRKAPRQSKIAIGDGQVECVNRLQVEEFLQRVRSGAS
jgi:hypothetical protein